MRIGFVLLSSEETPQPSTRISVLNMLPYLAAAGHAAELIFNPRGYREKRDAVELADHALERGYDLVYFQKIQGVHIEEVVRRLSGSGIRTVYGVCDIIDNAMADCTDCTIAVTDYLRSLYRPDLHPKIAVVHDGIENENICISRYGQVQASRRTPVQAILVTSQFLFRLPPDSFFPNFVELLCVGPYPHYKSKYQKYKVLYWTFQKQTSLPSKMSLLRYAVRPPFRTVDWTYDGVYKALLAADIGVIPVDHGDGSAAQGGIPTWSVKSENRLTLMMAAGLPVVASPVPSYLSVIRQGENGYIAATPAKWRDCLSELRDPARRERIGRSARESVIRRFSQAEQARRLLAVLNAVKDGRALPVFNGAAPVSSPGRGRDEASQ